VSLDIKLFILLFMSMGIDWMVQTNWEAINKFSNPWARLRHAATYTLLTIMLLDVFSYPDNKLIVISWVLLITHFIIDKRTIVTWWIKYVKRIPKCEIPNFWWMNIAIDQWLHMWVNLILCVIVTYMK